jgi:Zinc carboxypeptidase
MEARRRLGGAGHGPEGGARMAAFALGGLLALLASVAISSGSPRVDEALRPDVPSPESVLGFRPGADRHLVEWDEVLAYLARLDAASDRVRVEELGRTTQGRPFVMATVTSEANQARLEEIREVNLRLADPRGLGEEDAERLVHEGRAIVAMAFSIHSTEVGGTLAALRLLYELAASRSPDVERILDEVVLLVLPSHNPDGTQLVAEWYRNELGTPFEGAVPPVLYHPYVGHDDNRDWYMFTQVETRLTVEQLHHRWHPQIMHDVHQMGPNGARLFVPPYTDPWEPNVDPALVAAANDLGTYVASRLTTGGRKGIVTDALFDAWTPARAYPHTHGGVRLLSETASARLATPVEVRPDQLVAREGFDPRRASWNFPAPWPGGAWRLSDIVDEQLAVSLAVLDHAARNREHWLRTFLGVNRRACARREPWAFVVPTGQRDSLAATRLLEVLREGGVEVHRASAPFAAQGRTYEAGSDVILMQQPASAFAKTLLERQHYPDLREDGTGRPLRPYDATAHTLPLLLGVLVDPVPGPPDVPLEAVDVPRGPPGRVEGEGPRLALGHTSGDLVALGRLLESKVDVRWALEPFTEGDRRFAPGALLVPSSARERLETLAGQLGISARAVSARPRCLRLRSPRVGLYRSWVPSTDEGWTRFVFEKEMGVAYRSLHDREVRAGHLRDSFDAVVLPDQGPAAILNGHARGTLPAEYTGGLGREGVVALRSFVEDGGTLVAIDSAAPFAIAQLALPVRDVLTGVDPAKFFGPGTILSVRADPSQPLAQGLPEALPIWFDRSPAFEADTGTVVARYTDDDPLLSGWLLGGERLHGKAALVDVPLGKGHVVLFGFRPLYRAQSRVTYAALLNALYLAAAER